MLVLVAVGFNKKKVNSTFQTLAICMLNLKKIEVKLLFYFFQYFSFISPNIRGSV